MLRIFRKMACISQCSICQKTESHECSANPHGWTFPTIKGVSLKICERCTKEACIAYYSNQIKGVIVEKV